MRAWIRGQPKSTSRRPSPAQLAALVSIVFLAASCGDPASTGNSSAISPPNPPPAEPAPPNPGDDPSEETDPTQAADCTEFESTFGAIQTVIFENRGKVFPLNYSFGIKNTLFSGNARASKGANK